MKYQEAYDLIIEAYFKDEIVPMDSEFCFCGTLAPDSQWRHQADGEYPYTTKEYKEMERVLFVGLCGSIRSDPNYEEFLFKGMCAAIEVLKDIHRSRGEDVDCRPALEKRKLNKVL